MTIEGEDGRVEEKKKLSVISEERVEDRASRVRPG